MKELKGLGKQVAEIMKAWDIPGAAVAVVKDGEVVFAEGFGHSNIEEGKKATADTQFSIGSSTKAFTTTAIGMLVDDGILDWDTPIQKFFPELSFYDPLVSQRVTLRDMACHRTGLPRYDAMLFNPVFTRQEIVNRLQYLKPTKDFRTNWQYNNLMYATMGYIIERLTGLTWEDFVQQRILDALGMSNSTFYIEDMCKASDHAVPYKAIDGKISRGEFMEIGATGPAGSINSSVKDMTKWLQFNLNEGNWEGHQLIAQSNIKDIQGPQMVIQAPRQDKEISHGSYGLGWMTSHYRGNYMVQHGGTTVGFSSAVAFMPDLKAGVVAFTNNNGPASQFIAYRIFDLLLGLEPIDWTARAKERRAKMKASKVEEKDVPKVENTHPSQELKAYTGTFEHPGLYQLTVELLEEDKLKASYGTIEMTLSHRHYDVFDAKMPDFFRELKMHVSFHGTADGTIHSLSLPLGFDPLVEDLVFTRIADKHMSEASFLEMFCGSYEIGGQKLNVRLNKQNDLLIEMPGQPQITLIPQKGTVFNFKGLPGYKVEFKQDEVIITQPNGVFSAKKK